MNKQEFYKQKYRELKPGWQDSATIYRGMADALLSEDTRVLDVGCGHVDFMKDVYQKSDFVYGMDPNKKTLERNDTIKNKIHGSVEAIPFPDEFFDVVVSAWVLEHLEFPRRAFEEMYRVLKPGGKVIFLTPNAWNYNVWSIRLMPGRFQDFFTRKLYQRQAHDTFPTFYRINSIKTINRILRPIGFKKVQLIFNGDPSYISFNDVLFRIACFVEERFDSRFETLKVHLIGVYEK